MIPAGVIFALTLLSQDSSALALRRRVWDGLRALEHAEQQLTSRRTPPGDTSTVRILGGVRADLDTLVFATSWGAAELDQLRLAFPASALLARYAARLDERTGRADAALAEVDRLVQRDPADAELQHTRGRLLETTNRPAAALAAYTRALDLAPEDDSTFRALQRLAEQGGTLGDLLDQIRRLRIRRPGSAALADHEVEISQRMKVSR